MFFPRSIHILSISLLIPLFLVCGSHSSWAEVGTHDSLSLFSGGEAEETASSSRFPRPVSKIAENITVITSEDIARINAHTLGEVLQTVPGIELDVVRTPGNGSFFNIQGAGSSQVQVYVDGIPFNDFTNNRTEPEDLPAQIIDYVEIVKGAASAAWGPALGGVINVVTKSPDPDRQAAGMVSGSLGERFTTDSRGEASGTVGPFGYYLSAGNLHSDGLQPNNRVNNNNIYAKFNYLLPDRGTLSLGVNYGDIFRGVDEAFVESWGITTHDDDKKRQVYGFLKYTQPLAERLSLETIGYILDRDRHTLWGHLDSGSSVTDNDWYLRESSRGASAKVLWGGSENNLVGGVEYEHGESTMRDVISGTTVHDRTWDRWAVYGNGAFTAGPLTLLPGIRFDHTGLNGDVTSYTLGATVQLTESLLFRTYGAIGYGLPNPRFQHGLQKTKTVQTGLESSSIPGIWLKGTFFYNNLDDVEYTNDGSLHDQIKQGFEVEARTVSLLGLSLSGGYTYLDAWDKQTKQRLKSDSGQSVPPQLLKLALNYDEQALGLRGALTGNYVWWNAEDGYNPHYSAMIWDLHLTLKVMPKEDLSPELFFSGHNLFNGIQSTNTVLFNNVHRWFEGGVRFKF